MTTEPKHGRETLELDRLYSLRFSPEDLTFKQRMWEVLCERFFQPFIKLDSTVLDLGAGSCEFINAIRCEQKIAVDLNPDVEKYARGARVVRAHSSDMAPVKSESVDTVFSSNFFEHLPEKDTVLRTLGECYRVLRRNGNLIVMQPNIRYLPGRYWDYFDHYIPLSHLSMVEAIRLSGFVPERVIPRFLPYTVKGSRLPRNLLLLRLYLGLPGLWPVFGRQMLIVARRA